MLFNYLKICFRNLFKDKLNSGINLFGLTIGITAFLIIFQFVNFERSYDQFHESPDDVYRIATIRYARGEVIGEGAAAMPPLRKVIENGLPEVNSVARIYFDGNSIVEYSHPSGPRIFNEEKAYYADETFFEVFGFSLLEGTKETVLDAPRKIAISASTAEKYFGDESPMGKTLRVTSQSSTEYQVTGVFQDPPVSSHFRPEILFSFTTYTQVVRPNWGVEQNWVWDDFKTYLRAPGTNAEELSAKVDKLAHDTWGELYRERDVNYDFYAQSIQDIHTKSNIAKEFEANTSESILQGLIYVAITILVIAWVNYFNLSLAKCVERAREVGVRKTFGASRTDVKIQFWMEALIMNLTAIGLSILLFFAVQGLCETQLEIYYPAEFNLQFLTAIGLLVIGGLFFSLYPGIFLSRLRLLELVQGRLKTKPKGKYLVKGLIVFQMVATPMLIGGAYLIQQQTKHLVQQDLGVDLEQILVVKAPRVESGDPAQNFDHFRTEIKKSTTVRDVSALSTLPGEVINWYSSFSLHGDSSPRQYMNVNLAEYDFTDVLDIELVAGRNFDPSYNDSLNLIINESAARMWGFEPEEIIGKTFRWGYSPTIPYFDKRVIGVVKDYQQHAASQAKEPMIYSLIRYTPASFSEKFLLIKLQGSTDQLSSSIAQIESQWRDTYPRDPFTYEFLDDSFAQVFHKESQMLSLVKVFGSISFILAGLGLFGLSALVTSQRTKEVGIRKVLGANLFQVTRLLSRDFMLISLIAYAIALPLMWYMAQNWLSSYEIRIGLDMVFFVLPLVTTFVVVSVSTLGNSLSVAGKNPVDSLRYE